MSSTAFAALTYIVRSDSNDCYPNLYAALKVITTFPITVGTSERSFSKLKLIKTYLRSTMGQGRLTGLALISIEHEESRKVDTSDLIEKFARRKARKRRFTA